MCNTIMAGNFRLNKPLQFLDKITLDFQASPSHEAGEQSPSLYDVSSSSKCNYILFIAAINFDIVMSYIDSFKVISYE